MRRLSLAVAALAVLIAAGRSAAEDKPTAVNKLAALERFAGEWVVDGQWSDGTSLHARGVYEWGLGKKIMKARTFVTDHGKEYQRYESVMAWHPEKKSLFEISFAFDGGVSEVPIESKDKDTLHIGWVPYDKGKPSRVRQVITFLDKDSFQWVVTIKDGEEWKQLIDATWKRKGK
ncbi:MAG TPA: hypothetical protein VG013_37680 [Gemmataceae bacterium]|jgi:hypothetical protein|nr:hypothetical protein [Gemmataceae bacterium]